MPKNKAEKVYKFAVIASDIVIFTVDQGSLKTLLIQMKKAPFEGHWAAPGGLVDPAESVDFAAARILKEKTGLTNIYLEQLYTFGKVDRDPFGRVVSVGYFALISKEGIDLKTTAEYRDVAWFDVKRLPKLAYDHQEIIETALKRLKSKLEYTNIIYTLLPKEFTFGEMQKIYEIILGRRLDKRNFRKKILSLNLVKKLGKKRAGEANRPAQLFSFIDHKLKEVEII